MSDIGEYAKKRSKKRKKRYDKRRNLREKKVKKALGVVGELPVLLVIHQCSNPECSYEKQTLKFVGKTTGCYREIYRKYKTGNYGKIRDCHHCNTLGSFRSKIKVKK